MPPALERQGRGTESLQLCPECADVFQEAIDCHGALVDGCNPSRRVHEKAGRDRQRQAETEDPIIDYLQLVEKPGVGVARREVRDLGKCDLLE